MAPFTYDTPPPSPLVGSIGDLIARGGLQRAQLAEALAQTQSRAQVANAQAWGNATQSLGQLPIQMQEQARRDQLANVDTAYKLTQMQGAQAQLADQQQQRARRLAAGAALQKSITANTDPDTHEIDAQKVFTDVSPLFPDDAADFLKRYSGAQQIFSEAAKAKEDAANKELVTVGQLANNAGSAADFVHNLSVAQAAGHVTKKTLDSVSQDMATTDAWDPLKASYIKRANDLLPPKVYKEGDVVTPAIGDGTPTVTVPKDIKLGPDEKLFRGTNPDGTPKLLATGGEKGPTYTPEQVQYATAQGHDKPTLADIQAVANAANQRALALAVAEGRAKSGQTWEEFQRQQDYLNAHKDVVKAQGKPLSTADIAKVTDADKALEEIATLRATLQPGTTGFGASVGAIMPPFVTSLTGVGEQSKEAQAQIDRVRQVVGRQIHGGVMRANDQVQAAKFIPVISDPPALVASKLDALEKMVRSGRADHLTNLGKSGYNVSPYQPAETVGPDDPSAPAAPRIPRFNPATGKLE